jgi:hypothetical protein
MSAANALKAARAAGVAVRLDGDDLVLTAAAEPPAVILELLSQHKPDILALLRPGEDGWSAEDWRVIFDKRAGTAEFDGGLSRAAAEASAFTDCVAEWLNRNPMRSPPGRCFGCGGYGASYNPLLPIGIGSAGEVWLHSGCSATWYAGRKAEAVTALAARGIRPTANVPDDFGKNGSE